MPRLLLLLLALACGPTFAADAAPDAEPAPQRLREEARALRTQADDTLAARLPACYQRFQVNRCIAEEKEARLETIGKARALEAQAGRIERAQKQRAAAESGRVTTNAPTRPADPAPAETFTMQPDPTAEGTRRQRDADAARAASSREEKQHLRDAEKATERAEAEAAAAKRAEAAARDRARYDERIRKREAKKAGEAAGEKPD